MPIAEISRLEGPCDVAGFEPTKDVGILSDVGIIVEIDEIGMDHRPKCESGQAAQESANDEPTYDLILVHCRKSVSRSEWGISTQIAGLMGARAVPGSRSAEKKAAL